MTSREKSSILFRPHVKHSDNSILCISTLSVCYPQLIIWVCAYIKYPFGGFSCVGEQSGNTERSKEKKTNSRFLLWVQPLPWTLECLGLPKQWWTARHTDKNGRERKQQVVIIFFFFFFNHLEHEMNDLLMNYTMRTYRCSFGPERSSCSLRPGRPTRSRETRSTSDTRSTLEGKKERDKVWHTWKVNYPSQWM